MLSRVAYVGARLWTWEVVTGFDGVLDPVMLCRRFADDFPKVAETCRSGKCVVEPVFREMVSFNSTDGRKHRYLVMLAACDATEKKDVKPHGRGNRVLPRTAMLYGCADKLMRSESADNGDSDGNGRFAFLDNGWLYILVFFEGRLCHWSEEPHHNKESVQERLGRFDVFLRNDDLFSRAEKWHCAFMDIGNVPEQERLRWLRRAGRDPFWRTRTRGKVVWPAVAAGAALLLAVTTWWNVFSGDVPEVVSFDSTALPALTPPPAMRPSEEPAAPFNKEKDMPFNRATNTEDACVLPPVHLRGIVAGRIFSASIAGASPSWYNLGDSIGPFEVVSIGKDRVRFACGETFREVFNGI